MRFLPLVLIVACATASVPSHFESPVLAYPLNDVTLDRIDVIDSFDTLLRKSAYGKLGEERAGFLVYEGGRFRLVMWPPTHRFHAEEWQGAIPAGTVAVVHTHPSNQPAPSAHDRYEAERVGVPIIVLTFNSVELVQETGAVRRIRLGMTNGACCVAYTDRR
ncbi:MAG TPA: Mov34/MPN/PAD-1 family protein [Thermoanaerobaculia bacterium]|nr:Mov34/MPN/PAD-1 family protein [Thermoanaerobaculia bacterium]